MESILELEDEDQKRERELSVLMSTKLGKIR